MIYVNVESDSRQLHVSAHFSSLTMRAIQDHIFTSSPDGDLAQLLAQAMPGNEWKSRPRSFLSPRDGRKFCWAKVPDDPWGYNQLLEDTSCLRLSNLFDRRLGHTFYVRMAPLAFQLSSGLNWEDIMP